MSDFKIRQDMNLKNHIRITQTTPDADKQIEKRPHSTQVEHK